MGCGSSRPSHVTAGSASKPEGQSGGPPSAVTETPSVQVAKTGSFPPTASGSGPHGGGGAADSGVPAVVQESAPSGTAATSFPAAEAPTSDTKTDTKEYASADSPGIQSAVDEPPAPTAIDPTPAPPLPAKQPVAQGPPPAPAAQEPARTATQADEGENKIVAEPPEEEDEPPYKPMAPILKEGAAGDVRYRQARITSRTNEPLKTPKLDSSEEAELRRVWQEEWFSFPNWEFVALARVAVGRKLWLSMSNDRRRAAVERFMLCGPWAASQEPDEAALAAMCATSSSPRFVMLEHPARREFFLGAFATGHGLARVGQLSSERVWDNFTWDEHGVTAKGKEVTTADICYRIIIPATRAFGASYVDLYLNDELWGVPPNWKEVAKPGIGPKQVRQYQPEPQSLHMDDAPQCRFLSHAWGCPFLELVTAATLEGTPPRQVPGPYWIDIFCKNQHVPIKESDLTDNILGSKGVVLALWPWPSPLLVTRVWCLFEILNAIQTKVKLELTLCDGARSGFRSVLHGKYNGLTYRNLRDDARKNGLSSILPGADELIQAIDVRKAQATVAADKDMILRLIERDMGHDDMNKLIRDMLVEGLADAAEQVVDSLVGEDRAGYMQYNPY